MFLFMVQIVYKLQNKYWKENKIFWDNGSAQLQAQQGNVIMNGYMEVEDVVVLTIQKFMIPFM